MSRPAFGLGLCALIIACVGFMAWPLPLELGTAWTSARAEGDLAWSLVLHAWTTDALTGAASWTADPRVWHPDGGSLPGSAWNLVALLTTGWLGLAADPLLAWHRSMLFIGVLNGLGGAWLGYRVGGRAGAIVGAAALACVPFAWFEMCEGRLEQGLIAPLAVWFAEAWALARTPRPVLAGASLALVAATYWFLGPIALFVGLALPSLRPDATLAPLRNQKQQVALGALVAIGLVGLALAPVAGALASGTGAAAVIDPVLGRTQRLASSLTPLDQLLGGRLPAHRVPLVAWAWAPLAWRLPLLRPWLAAAALGAVLAAGSVATVDGNPLQIGGYELSLPLRMLDALPGFSRFWWPDRIVAVVVVAASGGLAAAVGALPRRWTVPAALLAVVLVGIDSRAQLRSAVQEGDPRIPSALLDPAPRGGFYARPTIPDLPGDAPALVGPWSTTPNTIPQVHLATGRPLLRGDGAADRRLWPPGFAQRVDRDPLLTALSRGAAPPPETPRLLDALGVDVVLWLGPDQRADWEGVLGCPPDITGPWATWDRHRPECR